MTDTSPVGVLLPSPTTGDLVPPESWPIGRAALDLAAEGVRVVFGDVVAGGAMTGLVARPGGWERVTRIPLTAAYDRFPSQREPDRFARLCAGLGQVPLFNPARILFLCRDKLESQRALEAGGVAMPELETDPARFAEALDAWGAAFLKPRYGSFGVGVRLVRPGDPLPPEVEGTRPGVLEPGVLQRAIAPPPGLAGLSVRLLCQRLPGGGWHLDPGVARLSTEDPVVNHARGAEVSPAGDVLGADTVDAMQDLALRVCATLTAGGDGERVVELGLDVVIDRDGRPWPIEVNSRPRGRLEALAARWPTRFARVHRESCARPLRYLARTSPCAPMPSGDYPLIEKGVP